MTITLPRWFDLHTHFRQGPAMPAYVAAHKAMGCAGALAMPNTQPPVSRVIGTAQTDSWSIESYSNELLAIRLMVTMSGATLRLSCLNVIKCSAVLVI
jgi:dihydroorotase